MLSLNSQMSKLSKTRKMSNFQMLSNSADFRKLVLHSTAALCSTAAHNRQDVNCSRNNPFLKICNDDETRNKSD